MTSNRLPVVSLFFLLGSSLVGGLSGCSFDVGGVPLDGSQPDADPDARDAEIAFDCAVWNPAPQHFDPCQIEEPGAALDLAISGTYIYDTVTGTLRDPADNEVPHVHQLIEASTPPMRLVSAEQFTVRPDVTLRAVGTHPLIVASWSTIEVGGTIDVSSSRDGGEGAGANTGACNDATDGQRDSDGGGGGGGGAFQGDGGDGGTGGDGDGSRGRKGTKLNAPESPRGGCPGGKGARGDQGDGGGGGGASGGGIQLTARLGITITGNLHAGGQGGAGADGSNNSRRSGGGGGGSGGMIGLEAPELSITATAVLAANGGGGGGGCNGNAAQPGGDGTLDDERAAGGQREGSGGHGGGGGVRLNEDGQNGDNASRGGGGGGGGVGYILIRSDSRNIDEDATLSPAPDIQ